MAPVAAFRGRGGSVWVTMRRPTATTCLGGGGRVVGRPLVAHPPPLLVLLFQHGQSREERRQRRRRFLPGDGRPRGRLPPLAAGEKTPRGAARAGRGGLGLVDLVAVARGRDAFFHHAEHRGPVGRARRVRGGFLEEQLRFLQRRTVVGGGLVGCAREVLVALGLGQAGAAVVVAQDGEETAVGAVRFLNVLV